MRLSYISRLHIMSPKHCTYVVFVANIATNQDLIHLKVLGLLPKDLRRMILTRRKTPCVQSWMSCYVSDMTRTLAFPCSRWKSYTKSTN